MENLLMPPELEDPAFLLDHIIESMPIQTSEEDEDDQMEDEEEEASGNPLKSSYKEKESDTKTPIYNKAFSLPTSGVYFDDEEMSMRIEYDLLYEELDPDFGGKSETDIFRDGIAGHDLLEAEPEPLLVEYETRAPPESASGYPMTSYANEMISIDYGDAHLINGQKTYQRIVFKADVEGESVYNLTLRKLGEAGIAATAEKDMEFDSMIFKSINGRAEGTGGNFNEFYLNGEIGADAVDKQKLSKGDVVEWRYAEETDGSCGGCPDFSSIKNMLEYSITARAQAAYFGMGMQAGPGSMILQNMAYS